MPGININYIKLINIIIGLAGNFVWPSRYISKDIAYSTMDLVIDVFESSNKTK